MVNGGGDVARLTSSRLKAESSKGIDDGDAGCWILDAGN